jgi:4-amino-4-deoxy-L-arabinose transferase-like glycosyltransferase
MIATKETLTTVRPATLAGRLERETILSWLGAAFPLAVSALLNTWNLAQNGYSNLYYSVAVQSMTQSWQNFFFASYDAGGFITVDKPPVALWIQAISAKLFGFSSLSLLLPEALAGVASVALLYYLVRRLFGPLAAFVAALALALTPIAVAVERTNNTDTWLMFTLLLAAWALSIATERGRLGLLALSLALVGVAFNIKMLAAFVVLPAFYLLYLVAARVGWQRRILHLALGSVVVFGVALSWPLAVQLVPPDQRPWVGGSQRNSVLDLALNYNGLGRVTGDEQLGGRGGNPGGLGRGQRPRGNFQPGGPGGFQPGPGGSFQPGGPGSLPNFGGNPGGNPGGGRPMGGPPGGAGGMFGAGQPGAERLFTGLMAGQWSWLFPLGVFGVIASILSLRRPVGARVSTALRPGPRAQAILLWGGWLGMYGVVFSVAEGIFHPYYLIMLAPAAAALVGIGVAALWAAYRRSAWQAWLLPAALLATAAWQANVLAGYPQWSAWLTPLLLGGTLISAAGLLVTRVLPRVAWRRFSPGLVGVSMVALLLAPTAWSITPVLAGPSNASLPTSGPEALNENDPTSWTRMSGAANSGLVEYLEANQGDYLYLLAVSNSQQASSIALATGKPVLAAGGFMGSDPALTVEKLVEMIAGKQVRFVMGLGGEGMRGRGASSAVGNWVAASCLAVDPSEYQGSGGVGFSGAFSLGNAQLYDCASGY